MSHRVFLPFVSLFAGTLIWAQSETGGATLNGTVTDPSGAAVAGAKVSIVNSQTGLARDLATNETGFYNAVRLPVGAYELSVELQGFKTAKRTGIVLNVGALATIDVRLEIGAATEAVTVTSEIPLIESTRSQTSTVVNQRAVSDLPINGRNFLDFALLTPGVVRDPRGGDLSFGGQRGPANSLLVDGGDSNNLFFGQSSGRAGTRNPYSFSQDAVQEFQVNSSGYNAETGRAGGGVINVVTKSGTNDLHGTAFWFYRDKALNANTFINNSRGIRKQPYHFNQFGGNLGGPIKRDKLFFFFNYDGQRNTNPNALFFPVFPAAADAAGQRGLSELSRFLTPYTTNLNNNLYTAKIDWNIGARDTLSVRYNGHRFNGKNFENGGPQSAAEHTGNSDVKTNNLATTYTHLFTPSLVWDARFIYLKDDEPGAANSDAPEAQVRENNILVMTIGRNNFSPRYTNTARYQTIQTLSYVKGRHTFKAGGDLNIERIDNFFPGNFSGSFQFNSYADFANRRPSRFTQAFGGQGTDGPLTKPHINEYAFFLQDAWRVTNALTLNYGVRYDLMNSRDPLVKNPDSGLASLGIDTSRMNLDTNNWAGRFGFAYRVTNSDRLLLRGGWGVFYGRTPAILTGTAHSQNGIQVQTYSITAGLPAYPAVLTGPPAASRTPDIYAFSANYVQPLTHQWNLNVETQLAPNWLVTLGYLGVRGMHLTTTRDVNLFPSIAEPATLAGAPVTIFRHPATRPNRNFGRISLFDSGQDSIYHGGFIQLTKRLSHNLQLLSSYTLSKVIDTVPEATSVVVGTGDDAKVAQDTLLPGLDRSLGDADVRHRFVLSAIWDIDYAKSLSSPAARAILSGYQLGIITNALSGRFSSQTVGGTSDINRDGNARTDRPPSIGRNTLEGPGFASVDFRFSKDINLTKDRARLRLIFEAFNLTNRVNFNNFNRTPFNFNATNNTFTPVATYLQRTGTSDPRILQLAAKIFF